MARPGSKAAKRRDPSRDQEWPVEKYPYMITKEYAPPRYFEAFTKARDALRDDVRRFQKQLGHDLLNREVIEACDELLESIASLHEGMATGTTIEGVIDPRTRMIYRATITRRKP